MSSKENQLLIHKVLVNCHQMSHNISFLINWQLQVLYRKALTVLSGIAGLESSVVSTFFLVTWMYIFQLIFLLSCLCFAFSSYAFFSYAYVSYMCIYDAIYVIVNSNDLSIYD